MRGKPNGTGGWTPDGSREETWGLDVFGNWDTYANAIGGTSFSQARTHNEVNELTTNAETVSSTTTNLDMEYDAAGNLYRREVSDTVRWVYTWDAWNRLVAVDIEEDTGMGWAFDAPRMKSGYYGLNQRAWSQIDAGAAGYTNNGTPTENLDRLEHFYYDASWRLLERRTDTSWSGSGFIHEETTQWVWGQRYIDELIAWADAAKSPTTSFDDTMFAMTDRNFSVIGLNNGERVRYDAYGYALASPDNDVDADGLVGLSDSNAVSASFGSSYGSGSYRVEADVNRDGSVNLTDLNAVNGASGDSIDRGDLSESGNIVGYAGYIFEPATGTYVVRHRWYSPTDGRWLSRDWIEYPDGQLLYGYGGSSPIHDLDPLGLLKIVFEGKFSEQEKKRMLEALEFARECASRMLKQLNEFMADYEGYSDCVKCELREEVSAMSKRIRAMNRLLSGDAVVKIKQEKLAQGTEAHTPPPVAKLWVNLFRRFRYPRHGLIPIPIQKPEVEYHPAIITFNNDGARTDWRRLPMARVGRTLLHELFHVIEYQTGSPDMDGTGTLYDPHVLDLMCGRRGIYAAGRLDGIINAANKKCASGQDEPTGGGDAP